MFLDCEGEDFSQGAETAPFPLNFLRNQSWKCARLHGNILKTENSD